MSPSQLAILSLVAGACLFTAGGCIRSYCEARGVSGTLVDGDTGKAIGEVPVTVTIDNHRATSTLSRDGHFDVKPRYKLVVWIAGDWGWPPPAVEVAVGGYEPYKTRGELESLREEGDHVHLGNLRMKKKEDTPSPNSE